MPLTCSSNVPLIIRLNPLLLPAAGCHLHHGTPCHQGSSSTVRPADTSNTQDGFCSQQTTKPLGGYQICSCFHSAARAAAVPGCFGEHDVHRVACCTSETAPGPLYRICGITHPIQQLEEYVGTSLSGLTGHAMDSSVFFVILRSLAAITFTRIGSGMVIGTGSRLLQATLVRLSAVCLTHSKKRCTRAIVLGLSWLSSWAISCSASTSCS